MWNKSIIIKSIALLLILAICAFTLSGCSFSGNIDRLAYVIAIGFDVGQKNVIKLSLQFSIPQSPSSGGSSEQSSKIITYSAECNNFDDGVNLINNYISKKINLSHARVIVFSEEFANKGVSDTVYTLINSVQIRPTANIVVSKCNSLEFLNNATSKLEKLSARYYETIPTSSEYTGYTQNISISDFFYAMQNTRKNPTAILGAVNKDSSHINPNSSQESNKYTAGQAPIESEQSGIENTGLAVFLEDKLIGELNNLETICHLLCLNKLKFCNLTIPNPLGGSDTIDLRLNEKSQTKKEINIVNGNPYIELDFNVECQILSMNENSNYFSKENIAKIEKRLNQYLEKNITDYLYKTAKEYKSDIVGFGQKAIKHFPTWDKWTEYDWLSKYKNSFFSVTVNSNIKSGQLLTET